MEMIVLLALLLLAGVVSVLGPDSHDYDDTDTAELVARPIQVAPTW